MALAIPLPQLQVDFALALEQIRGMYLQEALSKVVASLNITAIDADLAKLAPVVNLAQLAGNGLRGELMYAVPCILKANPRLLGYYRLLLGFSQKAFYSAAGLGRFKIDGRVGFAQSVTGGRTGGSVSRAGGGIDGLARGHRREAN